MRHVGLRCARQEALMSNMTTIEAKAFVPARDFALSKRFYEDLGFVLAWSSDDLAYFHRGRASFLLQNFYNKEHADNFMLQDRKSTRLNSSHQIISYAV